MKLFHLAFKDIQRQFRSRFALVFMFLLPILVTGIFYLMFSGGATDEAFALPQQPVVVVNLDRGHQDEGPVHNLGTVLIEMLQGDGLAELLAVTRLDNAESARAAVDAGEAAVAVVIPPDFTEAISSATGRAAEVELYADPTLTLGPQIVEGIVSSLVDRLAATGVGAGAVLAQLAASGITPDAQLVDGVVQAFTRPETGAISLSALTTQAPPGSDAGATPLARILGLIMAGMLVFYVFFTGGVTMQSIITEAENGTLPRLFTTATSPRTIFGGKTLAALLILAVQVTVLLFFGRLVFGIDWGATLPVLAAALATILGAAATGIFLMSLIKNSRQAGVVLGGVLTMTSMLGMITVFTASAGGVPPAAQTASLFVPQGWAVQALQKAMDGATLAGVAPLALGLFGWAVVLGTIGTVRLSRRYRVA